MSTGVVEPRPEKVVTLSGASVAVKLAPEAVTGDCSWRSADADVTHGCTGVVMVLTPLSVTVTAGELPELLMTTTAKSPVAGFLYAEQSR